MSEAETLLEDASPHRNLVAVVESDGSAIFFYLWPTDNRERGMRSCWVRNLTPAPAALDRDAMLSGRAPMLPRDVCAHPDGAPPLNAPDLCVIWFEEGDAAALLEHDEILAVIPGWSGLGGFSGYARDCTAQSPLAWPLGIRESNVIFERVDRNAAYWKWWETDDPWQSFQKNALAIIETSYGSQHRYFAIDDNQWPPKALVAFDDADRTTLLTIGVSLRAQPSVEMQADDARNMQRIELAFTCDRGLVDLRQMAAYVSAQSNLPWNGFTWLGDGHTIPCDALTGLAKTRFAAVLLVANPPGVQNVTFPSVRGDRVNTLWMIPITDAERELAVSSGSSALTEKLWRAGVSGVFRERKDVAARRSWFR